MATPPLSKVISVYLAEFDDGGERSAEDIAQGVAGKIGYAWDSALFREALKSAVKQGTLKRVDKASVGPRYKLSDRNLVKLQIELTDADLEFIESAMKKGNPEGSEAAAKFLSRLREMYRQRKSPGKKMIKAIRRTEKKSAYSPRRIERKSAPIAQPTGTPDDVEMKALEKSNPPKREAPPEQKEAPPPQKQKKAPPPTYPFPAEWKPRIQELLSKETDKERRMAIYKVLGPSWETGAPIKIQLSQGQVLELIEELEAERAGASIPDRIRGGTGTDSRASGEVYDFYLQEDFPRRLDQANADCLNRYLAENVRMSLDIWRAGGDSSRLPSQQSLPLYQELGGDKISDRDLDFIRLVLRYRHARDLADNSGGAIQLVETGSYEAKSERNSVSINAKAIADGILGCVGIPTEGLVSTILGMLQATDQTQCSFESTQHEGFRGSEAGPVRDTKHNDLGDWRLCSYSGVLVTSSSWAAEIFGVFGLQSNRKLFAVKSVVLRYRSDRAILSNYAKKVLEDNPDDERFCEIRDIYQARSAFMRGGLASMLQANSPSPPAPWWRPLLG